MCFCLLEMCLYVLGCTKETFHSSIFATQPTILTANVCHIKAFDCIYCIHHCMARWLSKQMPVMLAIGPIYKLIELKIISIVLIVPKPIKWGFHKTNIRLIGFYLSAVTLVGKVLAFEFYKIGLMRFWRSLYMLFNSQQEHNSDGIYRSSINPSRKNIELDRFLI